LTIVQWLLREGGSDIAERDNGANTALLQAAYQGHLTIVQWLLREGGADIAERDNAGYDRYIDGRTALLYAARNGHFAVVRWVLQEGGADIADRDSGSRTVWHAFRSWAQKPRVLPADADLADTYSIARCYGSPPPGVLIFPDWLNPLPATHRELLQRTEHAHVIVQPYRARRLDLLGWSAPESDFVRVVHIPDLQDIVVGYLGGIGLVPYLSPSDMLSAAVIAEAQVADDEARAHVREGKVVDATASAERGDVVGKSAAGLDDVDEDEEEDEEQDERVGGLDDDADDEEEKVAAGGLDEKEAETEVNETDTTGAVVVGLDDEDEDEDNEDDHHEGEDAAKDMPGVPLPTTS
jgi:hypothetical protein